MNLSTDKFLDTAAIPPLIFKRRTARHNHFRLRQQRKCDMEWNISGLYTSFEVIQLSQDVLYFSPGSCSFALSCCKSTCLTLIKVGCAVDVYVLGTNQPTTGLYLSNFANHTIMLFFLKIGRGWLPIPPFILFSPND